MAYGRLYASLEIADNSDFTSNLERVGFSNVSLLPEYIHRQKFEAANGSAGGSAISLDLSDFNYDTCYGVLVYVPTSSTATYVTVTWYYASTLSSTARVAPGRCLLLPSIFIDGSSPMTFLATGAVSDVHIAALLSKA